MVSAVPRLHIICGACGCHGMFRYWVDPKGIDTGEEFLPAVFIVCENCSTISSLGEFMETRDNHND